MNADWLVFDRSCVYSWLTRKVEPATGSAGCCAGHDAVRLNKVDAMSKLWAV
jgi:hypothetical protein